MKPSKYGLRQTDKIYGDMPPSRVVHFFLEWLENMRVEQEDAWETVVKEDARVQDFLHEIEFEPNSKKRALIDTRLHKSRVTRREAKDRAAVLKPIKEFVTDATNRGFVKRLKKLQQDLKEIEDFQASDRVYKPRVSDEETPEQEDISNGEKNETIF